MTARDDYPLSAQGAFSSVEGVKMLDEIDRLRELVDVLRWHAHKGDHPKADLTGDEWREVAFAGQLLHEAGMGDPA